MWTSSKQIIWIEIRLLVKNNTYIATYMQELSHRITMMNLAPVCVGKHLSYSK